MTTVRDILNQLPEPQRSESIANTVVAHKEEYLDEIRNYSAKEAIARLFPWPGTTQGNEYWKSFHASL